MFQLNTEAIFLGFWHIADSIGRPYDHSYIDMCLHVILNLIKNSLNRNSELDGWF